MLDPDEFLQPYGIRSLSRCHLDAPFDLAIDGERYTVAYEPAESRSGLFGGNSNWRGPVWFPINYLLIEALRDVPPLLRRRLPGRASHGLRRELPLDRVADDLAARLVAIFRRGRRRDGARCSATTSAPDASRLARRPAVPRVLPRRHRRGPGRQPPDRLDRPRRATHGALTADAGHAFPPGGRHAVVPGTRTAADINLVAQLLLLAGLLVGFALARRKRFEQHGNVQTAMVLLNLVLIVFMMAPSFFDYVVEGGTTTGTVATLMIVHGVLGTVVEIVALYLVLRMRTQLIPKRFRVRNIKLAMRATLALWTVLVLLGWASTASATCSSSSRRSAPLLQMRQLSADLYVHAVELDDAVTRFHASRRSTATRSTSSTSPKGRRVPTTATSTAMGTSRTPVTASGSAPDWTPSSPSRPASRPTQTPRRPGRPGPDRGALGRTAGRAGHRRRHGRPSPRSSTSRVGPTARGCCASTSRPERGRARGAHDGRPSPGAVRHRRLDHPRDQDQVRPERR